MIPPNFDYVGTVNLSNPRAIFAGSPPRFTWSRVTYEAYVVIRTSARPQVDSAARWPTSRNPTRANCPTPHGLESCVLSASNRFGRTP